ncbi:hypothetical protein AB0M54_09020 [Actinoplanes sp. NPDC051470]|uniref:hypothetical protein n=1 Tax=unclassified Actinoplanes TaxID=2626549 RepID=UPI0034486F46
MVFPGYPGNVPSPSADGPEGYTYAAVLLRPAEVGAALREIRFSGWVGAPENGWLPIVTASGAGTVAAGRRGVVGVASFLAERLGGTVLAVRVRADRQLLLAVWVDGEEAGRYLSDPSREPGAEEDVLDDPYGTQHAAAFAAALGNPSAAADLAELLSERLDTDSMIESERLSRVLRMFGLPTWLVAAASLPKDIPTGPSRRDFTRLGAGRPGPLGRLLGPLLNVTRKRRPPPPAVTDPPRGGQLDPWLL